MVTAAKPAVGGAVYIGATTATLPTSTSAAKTGFNTLGYISDAGLTRSMSLESENVKAWGGDTVLVLSTGKTETLKFALLDATSDDVLKLVHGSSNVTTSGSETEIKSVAGNVEAHKFVIDMIMADSKAKRLCVPHGVLTNVGDITYTDGGAINYEVTITCIPDSDGVTVYEYNA